MCQLISMHNKDIHTWYCGAKLPDVLTFGRKIICFSHMDLLSFLEWQLVGDEAGHLGPSVETCPFRVSTPSPSAKKHELFTHHNYLQAITYHYLVLARMQRLTCKWLNIFTSISKTDRVLQIRIVITVVLLKYQNIGSDCPLQDKCILYHE